MSLDELTISTVSVIASYSWPHRFKDVGGAIEFVSAVSATVEDPDTPIDQIKDQSAHRVRNWRV